MYYRNGILRRCKYCKEEFIARLGTKGIFCSKRCNLVDSRSRQVGQKAPKWRGGKFKDQEGYILVFQPVHPRSQPNGYIREHRLFMEKHLGRPLDKDEIVHHVNHNPSDNRMENLMLMKSNGSHSSYHRKLDPYKRDEKGRYIGR